MMATMTLRDVPDDLHRWLKQQAEAHHRSINKGRWVKLVGANQAIWA
jgi:hypothetical protein